MIITTWDLLHRFFTSSKSIWSTDIVPESDKTWLVLIILGVRLFTTFTFKLVSCIQSSISQSATVWLLSSSVICHRSQSLKLLFAVSHGLFFVIATHLTLLAVFAPKNLLFSLDQLTFFYLICFSFHNDFSSHWSTVNIMPTILIIRPINYRCTFDLFTCWSTDWLSPYFWLATDWV